MLKAAVMAGTSRQTGLLRNDPSEWRYFLE
jgi:hypothetical protein